MRIAFAGMSSEVPDGWKDQSTITYTMPSEPGPMMALNKGSKGARASIVLKWEDAEGATAAKYLDDRLEQLTKALPKFQVKGKGDMADGVFVEYELDPGQPMQQMLAVRRLGDQILCVTGTALTAVYPSVRKHFVAAMENAVKD